MTGGGDLDETLGDEGDGAGQPSEDPGHEVDPSDDGLIEAAEEDPVPSAGGADVGGRAGDDSDR